MLIGATELVRRVQAVADAGGGLGRRWAEETARQMQERVAVRSGRTRESIHVGEAGASGASVVASPVVFDIDSGSRAHTIEPKTAKVLSWKAGGRPQFARRASIPRIAPRPFRERAAQAAADKTLSSDIFVDAWNGAA